MTASMAKRERPRSWWIPYAFIAFFVVVIAANGTMIWLASATWPGLSSEDHYVRGLEYNEILEQQEKQRALGWNIAADTGTWTGQGLPITVRLTDRKGQALKAGQVSAKLVRPTSEGEDVFLVLRHVGPGRYEGTAPIDMAGNWDLVLDVQRGEDRHLSKRRIYVTP